MKSTAPVNAAPSRPEAGQESDPMRISVLVLVTYEPEPLCEVYRDLASAIGRMTDDFEFVFAVEPSFADQARELSKLVAEGEPIRVLQVGQAVGETALLGLGVPQCRGSIIVTTPAYRQVESASLVRLVQAVEEGCDLAIGRRWPRQDSWVNRAHTRAFHALAARVGGTGTQINDISCGVRAMRRELVEEIPLYGNLALFLPLLAAREGYRVDEVAAPQHPADQQTRVHSPFVYLGRLFDLLGLFFLLRFTEKPLRFFGAVGVAAVLPGIIIMVTVLLERIGGQGIADRPLLLLGVLFVVLGVQAIALGLIGEIIVHLHAPRTRSYRIRPPAVGE